jgi:hypothetical protein
MKLVISHSSMRVSGVFLALNEQDWRREGSAFFVRHLIENPVKKKRPGMLRSAEFGALLSSVT